MYNVLLKFRFEDQSAIDYDLASSLLSGFYQNGQLIDYYHYPVIQNKTLIYSGLLIQPDALDARYYTTTTIQRLQRFREYDHILFNFEVIGQLPSRVVNTINDVPGFILYQGGNSPVRTLDTFHDVPLYLLPKTAESGENYFNIICWQQDYESIYRLWFRGGVDEQYFYDQLTNYKSSLSDQGRELCKLISNQTQKDCYYHLFNDPNPDVSGFDNCPSCHSPWKLQYEIFDTFKYKCSNCFLIS